MIATKLCSEVYGAGSATKRRTITKSVCVPVAYNYRHYYTYSHLPLPFHRIIHLALRFDRARAKMISLACWDPMGSS